MQNANLPNLKSENSPIEAPYKGLSESKVRKVSKIDGEPQDPRIDTRDASANLFLAKVSTPAPAQACPKCDCSDLMDCVTYPKCPLCGWKDGPTVQEIREQQ